MTCAHDFTAYHVREGDTLVSECRRCGLLVTIALRTGVDGHYLMASYTTPDGSPPDTAAVLEVDDLLHDVQAHFSDRLVPPPGGTVGRIDPLPQPAREPRVDDHGRPLKSADEFAEEFIASFEPPLVHEHRPHHIAGAFPGIWHWDDAMMGRFEELVNARGREHGYSVQAELRDNNTGGRTFYLTFTYHQPAPTSPEE